MIHHPGLGILMACGDQMITVSGRLSSPFPKLSFGKNATGRTLRSVERWLCENALEEARSRGDKFNEVVFESELKSIGRLPQASKDSMELYLFWKS